MIRILVRLVLRKGDEMGSTGMRTLLLRAPVGRLAGLQSRPSITANDNAVVPLAKAA